MTNNRDNARLQPHQNDDAPRSHDRSALQAELDMRSSGQRLTPAQRRIAQCLVERGSEIGFLSSTELAELAGVSQPSVTRFAIALGFDGYLEMRKHLRGGVAANDEGAGSGNNRYQTAVLAELENLEELARGFADADEVNRIVDAMIESKPLAVVGLRVASGLAAQFEFYASRIHSDIRLITGGGSMAQDHLQQCHLAGGRTALFFTLPLHPRETVQAIQFARELGMRTILVTDTSFSNDDGLADFLLKARVNSRLLFDSYASFQLVNAVLLDAMCARMNGKAQRRLETIHQSSKKRRVFV
jgi:DNA-binding MurR/RpiR family transcriptional regulator